VLARGADDTRKFSALSNSEIVLRSPFWSDPLAPAQGLNQAAHFQGDSRFSWCLDRCPFTFILMGAPFGAPTVDGRVDL